MFYSIDNDADQPKSELELRMEKNIRERNEFFANMYKEVAKQHADIAEFLGVPDESKKTAKKRKIRRDENVSFRMSAPLERRKSERLARLPVKYTFRDLDDSFESHADKRRSTFAVSDLAASFGKPKKKSMAIDRKPAPVLDVSDVTDAMLARVAHHIAQKKYSADGSTCHQCRQKTSDMKTICRSGVCYGVRGRFCGICLKNRYGETVEDALTDPEWSCPPCRDLCNCSICRNNAGKRPTGILMPLARSRGFSNVRDFLENLNGIGDFVESDEADVGARDSDGDFFGFEVAERRRSDYDRAKSNLVFFSMKLYSLTDFLGFCESDRS